MTDYRNNASGGVNGQDVLTTNSGGTSGQAFDGVTAGTGGSIKWQAAAAWDETHGIEFTAASGQPNYLFWLITATQLQVRMMDVNIALTNTMTPVVVRGAGSTTVCYIERTSTGVIRLRNGAGTAIGASAAGTLVSGHDYRYELLAIPGTTTGNGRLRLSVYEGDGTTAIHTYDSSAAVAGTVAIASVRFGISSAATAAMSLRADGLAAKDTNTTEFGIVATAPVAIEAHFANQFVVNMTGSTPTGVAYTYTAVRQSGPTLTGGQLGTSGVFAYTADSTTDAVYRFTVTNPTNGLSSYVDVTITHSVVGTINIAAPFSPPAGPGFVSGEANWATV